MTERLIFWAQALDNLSPDHIDFDGEELSLDDTARRQNAVSLVSRVIKNGTRIIDKQGFRLTEEGQHFVVEVLSVERDHAGRNAPIICYGEYDSTGSDALSKSVSDAIGCFAKRISRNILSDHFELLREAFATLKKQSLLRKIKRGGGIAVVALFLLALGFWVFLRGQ